MLDDADHPLLFRWNTLFRGRHIAEAADFGIDLIRRWQEPHRAYHTVEHLDRCLALSELHRQKAEDIRLVEMALWYHDAVYEPKRTDNEAASAELAMNDLQWLNEPAEWSQRVAAAIRATATHCVNGDPDIALILDIDLAILADETVTYDAFEMDIRREYQHVPWPAYCQGRSQILSGFLARKCIYHSGIIDEVAARRNLTRAIHALRRCSTETEFPDRLSAP